jgi:phosphatidylserine/phosphatidylglycerophosphate/cardiolipin synthase-like enzyme
VKRFWKIKNQSVPELPNSSLYNENTFYKKFMSDLANAREEVTIESPFITIKRAGMFIHLFEKLLAKGVKIYIVTRDPRENENEMAMQAENVIQIFEIIGVQTIICSGNHHRKLAILDRKILWERSLNILSQFNSREIMRRIYSKKNTDHMFHFLTFNLAIDDYPV